MLSKVLAYLKSGGDANLRTISRKLEMEEGTVIMLLDKLEKLGYIEKIDSAESLEDDSCTPTKCYGCAKAISCEPLLLSKYRLIDK